MRRIAHEVMILYLGRPVEQGPAAAIFARPRHPYTQALLASTPVVDPAHRRRRVARNGELPWSLDPPPGCAFHRRCPHATEVCARERPTLERFDDHLVACHHADRILEDRDQVSETTTRARTGPCDP